MFKIINIVIIALFFSACSVATYSYNKDEKKVSFKIEEEKRFDIPLNNPKVKPNFDRCSSFSSTIKDEDGKYGKLFIEELTLNSNCHFNQDAFWAFIYEFKEKLKLKSLTKLNHISYENYDFYTFRVNGDEIVNFIFLHTVFQYQFIVDYNGKLSKELILELGGDTKSIDMYLKDKRFSQDYDHSLVRFNFFKNYFSGNNDRDIGE